VVLVIDLLRDEERPSWVKTELFLDLLEVIWLQRTPMNATSALKFRVEPNHSRQLDQRGLTFGLLSAENSSLDGFKVGVTVLDVLTVSLNTISSTRAMSYSYTAVGTLTTS
jgi:hypothetical protein